MQDTPRNDENKPRLVAPRTSRSGPSRARPTDGTTGPMQPGQRRNSKKSIFATSGANKTGPKQERPCKGKEKSRWHLELKEWHLHETHSAGMKVAPRWWRPGPEVQIPI